MTPNPTVAGIAAGLSEAQRKALLDAEWHGSGVTQFAVTDCRNDLPASLVHMFTLRWDRLTPLGQQVRNHLQEQQRHG